MDHLDFLLLRLFNNSIYDLHQYTYKEKRVYDQLQKSSIIFHSSGDRK